MEAWARANDIIEPNAYRPPKFENILGTKNPGDCNAMAMIVKTMIEK